MINKTSKILCYSVKTNITTDSVFSFGNDSVGMTFSHYGKKKAFSTQVDGVSVQSEKLYNLTDTTVFLLNMNRSLWAKQDSLYWSMVLYKVDKQSTIINQQHVEILFVKDTLFSIMQKDTTMLEKFKDYYSTQP